MGSSVDVIPLLNLAATFLPAGVVRVILARWTSESGAATYAVGRMVLQLLLVGYVLTFVFDSDQAVVVSSMLVLMLLVASWIALRPLAREARRVYPNVLLSIGLVSFPGMMTGQILSGVPPLVAVRYQIMVMSMLFGSAGISAACFLFLERRSIEPSLQGSR